MYISIEIMKLVAAKEEENKDLNRCLNVKVCPNCGNDLKVELHADGGIDYTCPTSGSTKNTSNCKFKHST